VIEPYSAQQEENRK